MVLIHGGSLPPANQGFLLFPDGTDGRSNRQARIRNLLVGGEALLPRLSVVILDEDKAKVYSPLRIMEKRKQESIYIDPLLRKIHRKGWTERLTKQFEKQYGRKLRWRIILHMEKLGLLQTRLRPERVDLLSTRRLELFENTLSDLWLELLDDMIPRYLERVKMGKVHQEFLPYLNGVIRHLVVSNARSLDLIGRETPTEILRSICEAKQDKTRHTKLAWAKFCFEHRVRRELLQTCSKERFTSAYQHINHITDYFFERFIPTQCTRLSKLKGRVLESLLDLFVSSDPDFKEALKFIGTVTPFATGGETPLRVPDGVSDDDYLSALKQVSQRGWL
jgi:hypothetical protein